MVGENSEVKDLSDESGVEEQSDQDNVPPGSVVVLKIGLGFWF